jgi:hypothetical protein
VTGYGGQAAAPVPVPAPEAAQGQGHVTSLLDQFTPEEREAISRLRELEHFPLPEIVHIFLAAGKNETYAANLLLSEYSDPYPMFPFRCYMLWGLKFLIEYFI